MTTFKETSGKFIIAQTTILKYNFLGPVSKHSFLTGYSNYYNIFFCISYHISRNVKLNKKSKTREKDREIKSIFDKTLEEMDLAVVTKMEGKLIN